MWPISSTNNDILVRGLSSVVPVSCPPCTKAELKEVKEYLDLALQLREFESDDSEAEGRPSLLSDVCSV